MKKIFIYAFLGFLAGVAIFYGFQTLFRSDTPWLGFVLAGAVFGALLLLLPLDKKNKN